MNSISSPASFIRVSADSHFPLQNLPFGVFKKIGSEQASIGVAIGEQVLNLRVLSEASLLNGVYLKDGACFREENLNTFMSLGRSAWTEARTMITNLLSADVSTLRDNQSLLSKVLLPQSSVEMQLPAKIGDYTDFYSSRFHATNLGTMFRGKDNALQPNWLHLPVGYHGRASSVVVSGTDIRRPNGQLRPDINKAPIHSASARLDFELEMAFFVGPKSEMGSPVSMENAEDHIFGLVLMNDWSARDIQKWEYVPLGPFNGKNFGTSISPWIVTMDALKPFKTKAEQQEPTPLPYLQDPSLTAYDIKLSVAIKGDGASESSVVSDSNCKHLYWSFTQQLAHHTSTGCNVNPGDLMASGTISGPDVGSYGSMLEISSNGKKPITLNDGSQRTFIEDGDNVIMSGYCQGNGYRVGFGDVHGRVLPAL